jgi:very-short-patch-repair endonuclease
MRVFNLKTTTEKRKNLRKNQTDSERKLWFKLRNKRFFGYKFFRQYGIGHYITDFYCPELKLVIEVDGGQHFSEKGIEYDQQRENCFKSMSIKTIRFSNLDILKNMKGVLKRIEEAANPKLPPPPL